MVYVNFALGNDAVRELASKALVFPNTRIAYFYKQNAGADGTVRITDVAIYIIDVENKVLIVADRST